MANPVNVTRLVQENDRLAAAAQYATGMRKGSITAGWHERPVAEALGGHVGVHHCLSECAHSSESIRSQRPLSTKQQQASQQAEAADKLLVGRRARMAERWREDRMAWQRELEARGLSLPLH